ncbi:hypothetical protein [Mycoplasmopsis gallinacea]|uniref:Uncharacterized protein n=1 Tax=Mycoplasmopsis gallinacea TaxID=29556 RepID=A0A6H0V3C6_9BACT|nr:hypothetical protein [Mycoplasmopsis gallinacea]QIW62488.1 hypothetical protein GOQ20_03655 [Mycoplasmopsis gallinacea]
MKKTRVSSVIGLSILVAILSIIETLAFIPKIMQKSKSEIATVSLNYSDINFIMTVLLMSILIFVSIVLLAKDFYQKRKNGQKLLGDNPIKYIFTLTTFVISFALLLHTSIAYSVFSDDLMQLSANNTVFRGEAYELAIAQNNSIKYTLLSLVFVQAANILVYLVYVFAKKAIASKKLKEV